MDRQPPTSVLFVCSQNSIRSPMAEALMKKRHGERVFVDSVGVRDGDIHPFAVAVMEELGVDLSKHRCKLLDDMDDHSFDVIITMSPEAQHRALELTRTMACDVEYWQTFDPSLTEGPREVMLAAFREVRDQIDRRIAQRFPSALTDEPELPDDQGADRLGADRR